MTFSFIKKVSATADFVVCDRFWPSTVAYGAATVLARDHTATMPPRGSAAYGWPSDMPKPANVVMFLLQVDEQTRSERLRNRDALTKEEAEIGANKRYRELLTNVYELIEEIIPVDASGTPENTLEFISHIIYKK